MRAWQPVILACVLMSEPLWAKPDTALHAAIRDALERQMDSEGLLDLAGRLAGDVDIPVVPKAKAATSAEPLDAQAGDLQAALTQLSILSGGNGHLSLQLAQASRTDAIYLLSGTATLDDLGAIDGLTQDGPDGWHLSRPLVIWPGATLILQSGDVLEMDAEAGAFLLSFGVVSLTRATLRGDAGTNPRVPEFRPFLLVAGQGTFRAEESTFADLGSRGPVAFRGVTVQTSGLLKPETPPIVIGSRFDKVFSLSFEGADGMTLLDNRFAGSGAAAISIKGGRGLTLVANQITGTEAGAGIRLSGALEKVMIAANLIRDGGRNGLQIDGSSQDLTLRANVVTDNAGAGVAIRNAACVSVQANILARNGTSGLRLIRSRMVSVADNAILSNNGPGIDVEAQAGPGAVLLSDNMVSANREGLRAAGLGEVRLRGNDLADQLPRQFSGDFAPWLAAYLTAGDELVIPAAGGSLPVPSTSCLVE
jgi:poly(beta-D-mannuronate) C5 epimerase